MKDQMPPVAQFSLPTKGQPQAQGSQGNTATPQGMPPVATFNLPNQQGRSQQTSQDTGFMGNLQSGNYGGAAVDAAKNVGNFLFPIAGDIKDDIQGKSTKTALQQTGDAALSILPFIPGLGEAGEALRGGEAAVEGAGAVADAAKGSGLLSKVLGSSITKNAGIGYGAGVASNLSQGQSIGQAITPNPTNIIGGVVGAATAGLGRLLGAAGDKTLNSILKPNAADTKDGFSLDTIKNNNLGGTLDKTYTKTKSLLDSLSSQLRAKLKGSNSSIDLAGVFDKTTKDLTSQGGVLSNFGQNSGIVRGLQRLQDEVLTANPSGSLSIPDAQLVKQASGGMGAWQYDSADPDATAVQTVYNSFYNNLKTAIEDNSPAGVKDINSKISELIPVMNAVVRRIPIAARNGGISLADMVGLVGSTMNPLASIPTAIEMASHSGLVGGLLSRYANRAGNALAPAASVGASRATSGLMGQFAK